MAREVSPAFNHLSSLQLCSSSEHQAVDKIIDTGKVEAGLINKETVLSKE